MKISTEFSKNALSYQQNNSIQNRVIKKLLSLVKTHPSHILDLGCGNGGLCRAINWKYKHFMGVDFAKGMLELHPKSKKIEAIYGNFNDTTLFDNLKMYSYDYIFSASALQWAEDLDMAFKNIKELNAPVALAIFTSSTFKTINKTASISSILKSSKEIQKLQKLYFDADFKLVEYKLKFDTTRDMFRYIKNSGVSGSRNVLSFRQTKQLMKEYPLNYLEFEVAFIISH